MRGIIYAPFGNELFFKEVWEKAIPSVKKLRPAIEIAVILTPSEKKIYGRKFKNVDIVTIPADVGTGSLTKKIIACLASPFELTAYLDTDTTVVGSLDYPFEKADQYGLAMCCDERHHHTNDPKHNHPAYNCGVMFFKKTEVEDLFKEWLSYTINSFHRKSNKRRFDNFFGASAPQATFYTIMELHSRTPFVLPMIYNYCGTLSLVDKAIHPIVLHNGGRHNRRKYSTLESPEDIRGSISHL